MRNFVVSMYYVYDGIKQEKSQAYAERDVLLLLQTRVPQEMVCVNREKATKIDSGRGKKMR